MMIDGSEIVRRRREHGWSTHQLAKQAGVGYSTVRGIEPTPTRPETAKKIADALGCLVADLVVESDVAAA